MSKKNKLIQLTCIKQIFTITLIAINISTFASSTIKTASSFDSVITIVSHIKDAAHTLVAFDDDDTLTMMPCASTADCQYLGGPAWFSWQSGLDSNDPKRLSPTFGGLLNISGLVLSLSKMPTTDSNEQTDLQQLVKAGYHTMVETARSPDLMDSTENQLITDHLLSLFTSHSPSNEQGDHSIADSFTPDGASRPIRYSDGVFYLSGQNKGLMLIALLARLNKSSRYHNVVLVDDTMKNITDFANAFKDNQTIHATAIYYKKLESHKHRFMTTPKLQKISNQRWQKIKASLQKNLLSFND